MIASIRPIWREGAILFYRWALAEMHPSHPDVPEVVLRLRELLDERAAQPPSILRRAWSWL